MEREYETEQATAAASLLTVDQAPAEPLTPPGAPVIEADEVEPEEPEPVQIFRNKRNRPPLKCKGGVSYNKPQSNSNSPGSWTAALKCFRKSGFPTEAAVRAKLQYWLDNDLCSSCERPVDAQVGGPKTEYRFK
jgi:hypothetical protein